VNKDQMMHELAPLSDLIARSSRGDENAFRELVEQHQEYVFALAFRLTCNDDDARDVVQETFVRVWKHLPSYDSRFKFTTWVYRITVNLAYDRLKAQKRRRRWFFPVDSIEDEPFRSAEVEAVNLENRDLAEKIKSFADHLPSKQRMVFVLRDLQDLSVEEVAQILNLSANSVKVNLCLARRTIRMKMMHLWSMEGHRS
jgi:RNA polymerase sigma-70 factor, ECF subfamily